MNTISVVKGNMHGGVKITPVIEGYGNAYFVDKEVGTATFSSKKTRVDGTRVEKGCLELNTEGGIPWGACDATTITSDSQTPIKWYANQKINLDNVFKAKLKDTSEWVYLTPDKISKECISELGEHEIELTFSSQFETTVKHNITVLIVDEYSTITHKGSITAYLNESIDISNKRFFGKRSDTSKEVEIFPYDFYPKYVTTEDEQSMTYLFSTKSGTQRVTEAFTANPSRAKIVSIYPQGKIIAYVNRYFILKGLTFMASYSDGRVKPISYTSYSPKISDTLGVCNVAFNFKEYTESVNVKTEVIS